jgi:uncharacterized cupredoxin-like copper-binding protein
MSQSRSRDEEPIMPDTLTRPPAVDADRVETSTAPTLATVVDELRAQGAQMRRTQQGFALFAVLALLLAGVNLLVVAAKLNGNTTTTVTRTVTSAAAAGAGAAAGTGSASGSAAAAAPLAHRVGIQLAEFTVRPTVSQAAAGKVTFAVQNSGRVTHEFVVLRTDKPAADLLRGNRADESGNVGETGDLEPGQAKSITLRLPAGHYALICNLPGHYAAGQHTDFTVKQ